MSYFISTIPKGFSFVLLSNNYLGKISALSNGYLGGEVTNCLMTWVNNMYCYVGNTSSQYTLPKVLEHSETTSSNGFLNLRAHSGMWSSQYVKDNSQFELTYPQLVSSTISFEGEQWDINSFGMSYLNNSDHLGIKWYKTSETFGTEDVAFVEFPSVEEYRIILQHCKFSPTRNA